MSDAGDFAAHDLGGGRELPLFDRAEGPFARSKVEPTPVEALVAGLIWRRAGRRCPIPIAEIQRQTGLSERKVKEVVEGLRVTHRAAIGASREEPAGYYRIVDAEDREAAVGPYRSQVARMFRVLRALDDPARVKELLGQMTLEAEKEG